VLPLASFTLRNPNACESRLAHTGVSWFTVASTVWLESGPAKIWELR
jgi:hypothetical protein